VSKDYVVAAAGHRVTHGAVIDIFLTHRKNCDSRAKFPEWESRLPLSHAMRMEYMTAFVAENCDTPVEIETGHVGVDCFECGDTGISSLPAEQHPARTCNDCKRSASMLVSVCEASNCEIPAPVCANPRRQFRTASRTS
jgi:hypothetical protein